MSLLSVGMIIPEPIIDKPLSPIIQLYDDILCSKCLGMDWVKCLRRARSDDPRATECDYYGSIQQIEQSAIQGCHLCRIVWKRIIRHVPPEEMLVIAEAEVELRSKRTDERFLDLALCVSMPQCESPEYSGPYVIHLRIELPHIGYKDRGSPAIDIETDRQVKRLSAQTVDSDLESLLHETIEPWLDDCRHGRGRHGGCRRRSTLENTDNRFWLPTRLIDVGEPKDSTVKLVETASLTKEGSRPKYLILSYCWGQGNETAITTRKNLEHRKAGIKIDLLPKTIRDAIVLTRAMKVRYLWIDAICIIQSTDTDDYLDDWRAEASKMGSYYAHSLCTISASRASDSSQGFLTERKAEKFPNEQCVVGRWRYGDRKGYLYVPPQKLCLDDIAVLEPLERRGWCIQERVLSPRVLHWTRVGLFWECSHTRGEFEVEHLVDLPKPLDSFRIDDFVAAPSDESFVTKWHVLLEEYSKRKLSHEGDRLAAMQGIATRMAERIQGEYFAGIFLPCFVDTLLWAPLYEYSRNEDFPSWSWAGWRTSTLTAPKGHVGEQNTLARCLMPRPLPTYYTARDFKDRQNRRLKMEAPLVEVHLQLEGRDTTSFEVLISKKSAIWPGCRCYAGGDTKNTPEKLLVLVLAGGPHGLTTYQGQERGFTGLIVERSTKDESEAYERVDYFEVATSDSDDAKGLSKWMRQVDLV